MGRTAPRERAAGKRPTYLVRIYAHALKIQKKISKPPRLRGQAAHLRGHVEKEQREKGKETSEPLRLTLQVLEDQAEYMGDPATTPAPPPRPVQDLAYTMAPFHQERVSKGVDRPLLNAVRSARKLTGSSLGILLMGEEAHPGITPWPALVFSPGLHPGPQATRPSGAQ